MSVAIVNPLAVDGFAQRGLIFGLSSPLSISRVICCFGRICRRRALSGHSLPHSWMCAIPATRVDKPPWLVSRGAEAEPPDLRLSDRSEADVGEPYCGSSAGRASRPNGQGPTPVNLPVGGSQAALRSQLAKGSGRLRQSSGTKTGLSIRQASSWARIFSSSIGPAPMKTISCRRSPQTGSR